MLKVSTHSLRYVYGEHQRACNFDSSHTSQSTHRLPTQIPSHHLLAYVAPPQAMKNNADSTTVQHQTFPVQGGEGVAEMLVEIHNLQYMVRAGVDLTV